MPSMKCYQCNEMKRCRMFTRPCPHCEGDGIVLGRDCAYCHRSKVLIDYLCAPCARELGYAGRHDEGGEA